MIQVSSGSKKLIQSIIARAISIVCFTSALTKFSEPYAFLDSIYRVQITNTEIGLLIACLLPWIEVTVSICLVSRLYLSGSFLLTLTLFGGFTIVQILVLVRGIEISSVFWGVPVLGGFTNYATVAFAAIVGILSCCGLFLALSSETKSHGGF